MFKDALEIASGFTLPVVLSRQQVDGRCTSSIGTAVVINEDGWIVTAGHIIRQWKLLNDQVGEFKAAAAEREAINAETGLERHELKRRLNRLPRFRADHTQRCSGWWGRDGTELADFAFLDLQDKRFGDVVDLGIGRLQPFDPGWIKTYPTFKDPSKNYEPGTSLCKLGFPFHSITPTWDDEKQAFVLPPGALPLPRFPIEGIFTRTLNVAVKHPNGAAIRAKGPDGTEWPEDAFKYVETSSPGLKGQSGGPIVDTKGTIWAIQAKTQHLHLGFSPEVPGRRGQVEHQFLNVGLGVHVETIFRLFADMNISYKMSEY